jgi:hypothetical protein
MTSALPVAMSLPSTLPMKLIAGSECRRRKRVDQDLAALGLLRSHVEKPTRGAGCFETRRA